MEGGGQCLIVTDYPGSYEWGCQHVDKLLMDLGVDFTFPNDVTIGPGLQIYENIAIDPSTYQVQEMHGFYAGRFEVGDSAKSLVMNDDGYTVVCRSPII